MATFQKGEQVRQILPAPIVGNVVGFQVDQETGAVQVCVEYQENGETRQRFFTQDQIEAAPAV